MSNDFDSMAQLEEKIHQLPPYLVTEVDDFVSFLLQKYQVIRTNNLPTTELSVHLESESFVGMWRNHDDMVDSVIWTRNLRLTEWG